MFENGSFLRRRKRFKLEEGLSGNVKSVSNPIAEKVGEIENLPRPTLGEQEKKVCPEDQLYSPYSLNSISPPVIPSASTISTFNSLPISPPSLDTSALARPSSNLAAAYSTLMMQYTFPYLWSIPSMAMPPYMDPKFLSQYASLISKRADYQARPSSASDCESFGDRSSPLSVTSVCSPNLDSDCFVTPQDHALDLSAKH